MKRSTVNILASYIDALHPIIYINHFDFKVIDEAIAQVGEAVKCVEFNNALGLVDFRTKSPMQECDLEQFLKLTMDDGFEQVYQRIREILAKEKDTYRDEIKKMQELIREITDKSATVQTQELRNRELAVQKFSSIKKEIKKARTTTKAASQYYKNMAKMNVVDSQFLDQKK